MLRTSINKRIPDVLYVLTPPVSRKKKHFKTVQSYDYLLLFSFVMWSSCGIMKSAACVEEMEKKVRECIELLALCHHCCLPS